MIFPKKKNGQIKYSKRNGNNNSTTSDIKLNMIPKKKKRKPAHVEIVGKQHQMENCSYIYVVCTTLDDDSSSKRTE